MNKSLPSRFTVSIPVKPYVKRFLDINFGLPVDFWTSTPNLKIQNSFYSVNLGFMRDNLIIDASDPNWSYSIRCVKDKF
jgi:hypothetical protein